MNKGQVMGVFMTLVLGVIGVIIVANTTQVITTTTAVTNESLGVVTNGTTDTLAQSCVVSAPSSVYDWTSATEIATTNYTMSPGTYPNREANTITWPAAGFSHNNSIVGVNYTYNCDYHPSPIVRMMSEYIAVLVALGLLMLAGGWFMMR